MSSVITATNQLVTSKGVGLDRHLTFEARRSHFATEYNKIANHSKFTVSQPFRENVNFGKTISVEIDSIGDFLSGVILRFRLPALTIPEGSRFIGWTQTVGYAMIENLELRIGDMTVVSQMGSFAEVMDYLQTPPNPVHWDAIGRYDTVLATKYTGNKEREVLIPLNLWFTKKLSQAIPIFALNNHKIRIVLTLKPFQELITWDGEIPPPDASIVDSEVISEHYVVTEEERDAQYLVFEDNSRVLQPKSYLIDQWYFLDFFVPAHTVQNKFHLSFAGHVKELVFYLIEEESLESNDPFMFGQRAEGKNGAEFITSLSLLLDGKVRLDTTPELYYRLITPQKYHTYAGNRNIYVIPFSETPEQNKPCTTLDFSAYDTVELLLDFVPNIARCRLHVLAVTVNRLTFFDETVQLEYTSV